MSLYNLQVENSIKNIGEEEYRGIWQGDPFKNLFTSWEYLSILEESNCIGQDTGWAINFFTLQKDGQIKSVAPCFLKFHSYGEYVFDWAWAEAFHRSGVQYYPKLLFASPFTPISGARLLGLSNSTEIDIFRSGIEKWCRENSLPTAHMLFCHKKEISVFEKKEWLTRKTVQFHWRNMNYECFDDFLGSLQQKKRKKVKSERKKISEKNIVCRVLTGDQIRIDHLEFLYRCYRKTYANHFSTPYLNEFFFNLLYYKLQHNLVISIAYTSDDRAIASSLAILENINGEKTLFGRYWGAIEDIPFLHFEVAYYSLIEWSILHEVKNFEGGAQGEHKLARGFEPVVSTSIHWICNENYREAIQESLVEEHVFMENYLVSLKARSAYISQRN